AFRRPVDALVGHAVPGDAVPGDLEVVDLLKGGLARRFLVVFVRRVGRPAARRGEHLARDELLGEREALRRAEVVDLAARRPGPPQLDRDVPGGAVARFEARLTPGPGQREPA